MASGIKNIGKSIADFFGRIGGSNSNSYTKEEFMWLLKSDSGFLAKLSLKDLLEKDATNRCYLEYVCESKIELPQKLIDEIKENKQALYICATNDHISWLKEVKNEDIFFEKVKGVTTFASMLDMTLLDYILMSDDYSKELLTSFKKRHQVLDYFDKYNIDFSYISKELAERLFTERSSGFDIYEYKSNKKLLAALIDKASLKTFWEYCKANDEFGDIKYCKEDKLLAKVGFGTTLLEKVIKSKECPRVFYYPFKDKRTVDILIKYDRLDLLCNVDAELLFSPYNGDKTYFDLMIEEHKKGKNMHFENLNFKCGFHSSKVTAIELITLSKNKILGYVSRLSPEVLLYKGPGDEKSTLEWLFEMDKNILLSEIYEISGIRDNPNIIVALKTLGVENVEIKIKSEDETPSDDYIKCYNEDYAKGCKSKYEKELSLLRSLFESDGISNMEAVDALITSYRYLTSIPKKFAVKELKKLIEIKKLNPDRFVYRISEDNTSYFSPATGGIYLNELSLDVVVHETTHALHHYLADSKCPKKFRRLIKDARKDPRLIGSASRYSKKYDELYKSIKSEVNIEQIEEYYNSKYSGDNLKRVKEFLATSKEEQKKLLKDDYPEDVLDAILDSSFSFETFLAQRKKIAVSELVSARLRCEYGAFLAISDIIDAIFSGKFYDEVLLNKKGKVITGPGHGIEYYSEYEFVFSEIIANYGTIIKSKNSDEMLAYLRKVVGDNIVNFLDKFYNKNILGSYSDVLEDEIELEEEKSYGR